jgi:predicted ATPase
VRDAVQAARVVTLAGPGGTGKTRLALEAAGALVDTFADGVWLVELAPVADATAVPRAVADALGARAEGDVPPLTLIETALRDQRVLLLLDNCEHVVEEAATLTQALLRALPRLHVLATSREALGVAGERVYRVPSMSLPTKAARVRTMCSPPRRARCLPRVRRQWRRTSRSRTPTQRPWRACAGGSTAYRWPSSSRRRA